MPEVNAQERQRLKQESAQMAITDANLSQGLAAAGTIVMLFSPPHGVVLALGSAAMGVCGNYRQSVANDPPRDDFGEVWVTQATLDESVLPADERHATLHRFAAHQVMLSDAHYALLRSLERFDGAVNAGDLDAASIQADAARQNAEIGAAVQDALGELAAPVNETWNSLRAEFELDWSSVTLEEVQQAYRDAWGEPPQAPGAALQEFAATIGGTADDLLEPFDPVAAHPILSATELPGEPETLIEDDYPAGLASLSSILRGLVSET